MLKCLKVAVYIRFLGVDKAKKSSACISVISTSLPLSISVSVISISVRVYFKRPENRKHNKFQRAKTINQREIKKKRDAEGGEPEGEILQFLSGEKKKRAAVKTASFWTDEKRLGSKSRICKTHTATGHTHTHTYTLCEQLHTSHKYKSKLFLNKFTQMFFISFTN